MIQLPLPADFNRREIIRAIDPAKDVYSNEMVVVGVKFITNSQFPFPNSDLAVKIRYQHPAVPCQVEAIFAPELKVRFKKPQRAVTPGQSAVFYLGDKVIGVV